jgi:hypothetical protein
LQSFAKSSSLTQRFPWWLFPMARAQANTGDQP